MGKAELVELKVALTFFMLMCYFDNYPCQHQKITYMPAPVFLLEHQELGLRACVIELNAVLGTPHGNGGQGGAKQISSENY